MVNLLGASPIVGLLNIYGKNAMPYTFGGDGCMVCLPPKYIEQAKIILSSCRKIGKKEFELNLRAALIPISFIRTSGFEIKVARYKVSEVYNQAVFAGGGLTFAEELLKSTEGKEFSISSSLASRQADFTGLECRWQEVDPQNKQVITLLIKSNPTVKNSEHIYQKVLTKMEEIFGFDHTTNPINPGQLNMNFSISELMCEVKFRTFGKSFLGRILYLLKVELQVLLGKIFMKIGYRSFATDWSLYKTDVALNSDHRKFDDMLRLVISGTEQQLQEFTNFLEKQYQASKLAYGTHITNKALFTCMVFKYHRDHVHFVDGNNGGYVMASQKLKTRLQNLSANRDR